MVTPEANEQIEPVMEVVTSLTPAQLDDVCNLYAQLSLSGKTTTPERVMRVLQSPGTKMLGVKDKDRIIGVSLLYLKQGLRRLYVELDDVILDADYRGRGLGEAMVRRAIKEAEKLGAERVVLSSVEERKAAHGLYEKIGFERCETRNYEMTINRTPEGEE